MRPAALLAPLLALGLGLWASEARAQNPDLAPDPTPVAEVQGGAPLLLPEVIDRLDDGHPLLDAADAKVDGAEGKRMSARGGFDPKLHIKGKWVPVGYYPRQQLDVGITAPTPLWGIGTYAGWRIGQGETPVYKGDILTGTAGELYAGLNVPVYRDGPIDARRAKIKQAELGVDVAEAARDEKRLAVELKAAESYWKWVEAGRKLDIEKEMLGIAEVRNAGIQRQVEAGLEAEIKAVDNRRTVLDRQARVIQAEADLQTAAVTLALYYRGRDGQPTIPAPDRLPPGFPAAGPPDAMQLEADIEDALRRRPDLARLQSEREQLQVDVRLSRNQMVPQIDLQAYVLADLLAFGAGRVPGGYTSYSGSSGDNLRDPEFGTGVVVEVPIPLRKARGALRTAKAEVERATAELQFEQEQAAAEIRAAHATLTAAYRNATLARQLAETNRTLAEAERKRFDEGSSDLLRVNLREIDAAKAAKAEVEAWADYQRAIARYTVATGRGL